MEHTKTVVGGFHHITAIAGAAQENVDFYVGVLGLRLVKKSINQDVPDTYHLFFADGDGNPGTDLTFFPWPSMAAGRLGAGVWGEVGFTIPKGTIDWWEERLTSQGVRIQKREERFGEPVVAFQDPHGMALSLHEGNIYEGFASATWEHSTVPKEYQIQALGTVTLPVRDEAASVAFLSGAFGFEFSAEEQGRRRYIVGTGDAGQRIDIIIDPSIARGTWGVGSVHHVAFRVPDDQAQAHINQQIIDNRGSSSGVIDRFWFKSVYVREPSGALCEVATDGPGFGVDEDMAYLGETLVLPPWYESQREAIEGVLPKLTLPKTGA